MKFKFKKDAEVIDTACDDFMYMLFDGGYIHPEKYLEDEDQIRKLKDAISLIKEFKLELENAGLFEEC